MLRRALPGAETHAARSAIQRIAALRERSDTAFRSLPSHRHRRAPAAQPYHLTRVSHEVRGREPRLLTTPWPAGHPSWRPTQRSRVRPAALSSAPVPATAGHCARLRSLEPPGLPLRAHASHRQDTRRAVVPCRRRSELPEVTRALSRGRARPQPPPTHGAPSHGRRRQPDRRCGLPDRPPHPRSRAHHSVEVDEPAHPPLRQFATFRTNVARSPRLRADEAGVAPVQCERSPDPHARRRPSIPRSQNDREGIRPPQVAE
jgi:hypothetical protein